MDRSSTLQKTYANGPASFKYQAGDMRPGANLKIGPPHGRFEKCVRGAPSGAIELCDLVEAKPLLRFAVEIVVARKTRLLRRLHEGPGHRINAAQIAHVQRSTRAMQLGSAALLVLRLLEVGKDVVKAPARITQVAPRVIVVAMAADVDHGVDRAAATQDLAAGPVELTIAQLRLLLGIERPIAGRSEELAESQRDMNFPALVWPTRLQQQDLDGWVLRKPVCQHASGRASPNDDVVIHAATPW